MGLRNKRRELQHGLVGALGPLAGLAGFGGGFYAPTPAIVAMFGIGAVGATLVYDFTDRPRSAGRRCLGARCAGRPHRLRAPATAG